jgi:ABC-type lipoprotein export system ATPase subunit
VTDALVELRDVFRVHRTGQGDAAALQGAELDVVEGEVLCVLGPSGAGKSTLLRVIAGIETPSAGTVRVLGSDIGRQPERARARFRHQHLGLLTQSLDASASPLSASQAVELPLSLRGYRRQDRSRRAEELLAAVGLAGRRHARLTELSGGERQRIALCAAIAHRPALLLADEPTGELDDAEARTICRMIAGLARTTRMTVVIGSHDQAVAESADRTLTIAGGRIAEERQGDRSTLLISRGGWLRLPPGQREQSAINSRARSRLVRGNILVEPTPDELELPGPDITPAGAGLGTEGDAARVEVRGLDRAFGWDAERRFVLEGVSHRFAHQGFTVVAGRSGTGKTTLLRLIAGLDQPDAGQVLIDEQPLTGCDREELASLRRERMGYMPQEPATVEFMSARENVALALALRGIDPGPANPRMEALLERLGLAERADQRVHRLSAGEVQRVALARAMVAARGLLIIDEPTSRLDEASAELVAGLLGEAAQAGQTVICASHDPRLIERADALLNLPRR